MERSTPARTHQSNLTDVSSEQTPLLDKDNEKEKSDCPRCDGICCHCCCGSRSNRIRTALIVVLILILVGVAAFFLFPRRPKVCTTVQFNEVNVSVVPASLSLSMLFNFTINNPNYFGVSLNSAQIRLYYAQAIELPEALVASAATTNFDISSRSVSNVNVITTVGTDNVENTAVVKFAEDCGKVPAANAATSVGIEFDVSMPFLFTSLSLHIPRFHVSVPCPNQNGPNAPLLDGANPNPANSTSLMATCSA